MTEEQPTVEIDGVTWRDGDIGISSDGTIVQLKDYASTGYRADRPVHERWHWAAFDTEYNWAVFPDPKHPRLLESSDPHPPFTKMKLVAHD